MAQKTFRIVGRMKSFWPHLIGHYEMHRLRLGGNRDHIDPTRSHLNRALIGDADWATTTANRIEQIRRSNFDRKLASLQRRQRKSDLMDAIAEGAGDPWRPTEVGPMRELILTASRDFFAQQLPQGQTSSMEAQFEAVAIDWLRQNFGDTVIHARADLDETTYHIHAVIMPVAVKEGGRQMLEPSAHPFIKNYERMQDSLGVAFAALGLTRGEERAKSIRDAKDKRRHGQTVQIPPQRKHVPAHIWREQEAARLDHVATQQAKIAAEQAATAVQQEAATVELDASQREQDEDRKRLAEDEARLTSQAETLQQRETAAEAREAALTHRAAEQATHAAAVIARERQVEAHAAEITRRRVLLDEQAADQDAFAAAAEAVASGMIDPSDLASVAPVPRDEAERTMLARMRKSPAGLRRFLETVAPAWARLREQARAEAQAEVKRELDQIESLWRRLRDVAVRIDPACASLAARDAIDRALAVARTVASRPAARRRPDPTERD